MTEAKVTRRAVLTTVRRRDRAEALVALKDALEECERIAADRANVRRQIEALERRLALGVGATETRAGRLARHIDHERRTRDALYEQRRVEAALIAASERSSARVDEARDRVARSQKALNALENQKD
jgi:hypothetical protein